MPALQFSAAWSILVEKSIALQMVIFSSGAKEHMSQGEAQAGRGVVLEL